MVGGRDPDSPRFVRFLAREPKSYIMVLRDLDLVLDSYIKSFTRVLSFDLQRNHSADFVFGAS